jgi:hypothetical protein
MERDGKEQRLAEQEKLTKQIAKAIGVRLPGKSELRNIVLICWVLGNSWLSYVESTGCPVDETALDDAVEMLMQHYKPYLEKTT